MMPGLPPLPRRHWVQAAGSPLPRDPRASLQAFPQPSLHPFLPPSLPRRPGPLQGRCRWRRAVPEAEAVPAGAGGHGGRRAPGGGGGRGAGGAGGGPAAPRTRLPPPAGGGGPRRRPRLHPPLRYGRGGPGRLRERGVGGTGGRARAGAGGGCIGVRGLQLPPGPWRGSGGGRTRGGGGRSRGHAGMEWKPVPAGPGGTTGPLGAAGVPLRPERFSTARGVTRSPSFPPCRQRRGWRRWAHTGSTAPRREIPCSAWPPATACWARRPPWRRTSRWKRGATPRCRPSPTAARGRC